MSLWKKWKPRKGMLAYVDVGWQSDDRARDGWALVIGLTRADPREERTALYCGWGWDAEHPLRPWPRYTLSQKILLDGGDAETRCLSFCGFYASWGRFSALPMPEGPINLRPHAGKWVALNRQGLVAVADTREALIALPESKGCFWWLVDPSILDDAAPPKPDESSLFD